MREAMRSEFKNFAVFSPETKKKRFCLPKQVDETDTENATKIAQIEKRNVKIRSKLREFEEEMKRNQERLRLTKSQLDTAGSSPAEMKTLIAKCEDRCRDLDENITKMVAFLDNETLDDHSGELKSLAEQKSLKTIQMETLKFELKSPMEIDTSQVSSREHFRRVNKVAQAIQKQRVGFDEITAELEGMREEVDRVGKKVDRAYYAAAKNISNGLENYSESLIRFKNVKLVVYYRGQISAVAHLSAISLVLKICGRRKTFDEYGVKSRISTIVEECATALYPPHNILFVK